jgi:hypothetical protein
VKLGATTSGDARLDFQVIHRVNYQRLAARLPGGTSKRPKTERRDGEQLFHVNLFRRAGAAPDRGVSTRRSRSVLQTWVNRNLYTALMRA